MSRFPLTNKPLLEKWENIIRSENNDKEWQATSASRICSKHFSTCDYIVAPSKDSSCRIKKNAVPTIFSTTVSDNYGISKTSRKKLVNHCHLQSLTSMSSKEKVSHDHTYCQSSTTIDENIHQNAERPDLKIKLKRKIKSLQQQLRRTKAKQQTMSDIINELQQKLVMSSEDAEMMHCQFDAIQLSIFRDTKNNVARAPCGRRYSDIVKEFAVTLHYYSPKAYEYVRSILPLPQPSLIRKWSSTLKCEPGFIKESFEALRKESSINHEKSDCCLVIDALSTRKQMLWDNQKDAYVGFVDYGPIPALKPDTLATEAVVFLLVGTRSNWKCPIGYFLADKMSAQTQAELVKIALKMAAEAGLRVWTITADGTTVNVSMFKELGCEFGTEYDSFTTKFKHPSKEYFVYVILDPCHMLKLARNALAELKSLVDSEGNIISWHFFSSLKRIQEDEGFNLANKFTSKHFEFQKKKMNVALAAQTLSSSVADSIEFLNKTMKHKKFEQSNATVKFVRVIDRLFDMLNSRNPIGKGFKQPLRPERREIWEEILKTTAEYLLGLKTIQKDKLLSTHKRKTFIIGFVATIKSTLEMTHEMFSTNDPFKYLLTYKFSQDHIELLFSCIRAKGGWNNNPNCLQLKYALRKMLLRNAITASKNANCLTFETSSTSIIPFFHSTKHKAPLSEAATADDELQITLEEKFLCTQLNAYETSEFVSNILFYIGGYLVSKLVNKLTCLSCKNCLISQFHGPTPDHDYCATRYSEISSAAAFTLFVNNGGLRIPSQSVYHVVEYSEKMFKQKVLNNINKTTRESKLKEKLVMLVCYHFTMDSNHKIFNDHIADEDHRSMLIKATAERYFTLRLFTYSKRYNDNVTAGGKQGIRQQLTKLILFNNL